MIIKSISHHDMSTKEFKYFTKDPHASKNFADWRQASKTINFGVLFNCSAPTLAQQLEDKGYTEEEALIYIHNMKQEKLFNEIVQKKRGQLTKKKCAFLCAATLMLEAYYKAYPGVPERTKREADFGWEKGYARCWHGPVRHLPELRFMKRNAQGELIGADKRLYSSMVSNRQNQAGNSPIQCMEANIAINTIISVCSYVQLWKLKSYIWNMVHDSEDWIVYKPEADLITSLIEACSTWSRQPEYGVKMKMDFSFCDPSAGYQHNFYHGGIENPWKAKPIEEAVKEWNDSHKDVPGFEPIEWHGCVL